MVFFGTTFNSLQEFYKFLDLWEQETCSKYFKRSSESVAAARARGIKRPMREDLEFYFIKFHCIHGGKSFKSMSSGARQSSSFQQGCGAHFKVSINTAGDQLVISQAELKHNHVCNKLLYSKLPQVRILPQEGKQEVHELLALGANKKKLVRKIQQETGKQATLKDLSNIFTSLKTSGNDLVTVVKLLESQHGAECKVLEERNVFKGLFFCTKNMQKSFAANPEFLGIDGTFKLLNIRAPVYLTVVEDADGLTEVAAVAILVNEDAESVRWFVHSFKEVHPAWRHIRCVMADKDLNERSIIKSEFPQANVLICVFHTLRIFSREVTCEKLGLTQGQRDSAKELLTAMVYASTDAKYAELYARMKEQPRSVQTYFDENWHSIRAEWTLTADFMMSNFLNTTNNRLESLNGKIKSVVKKYSGLEDFVNDFFVLINCLKSEHEKRAAYMYLKPQVVDFESESPEYFYFQLLTTYAFKFVEKELKKLSDVKFEVNESQYRTNWRGTLILVDPNTCACLAFTSMLLPCRHVFALRQELQMDLKEENLCAMRWFKSVYMSAVFEDGSGTDALEETQEEDEEQAVHEEDVHAQVVLQDDCGEVAPCGICSVKPGRVLGQNQKFRRALLETNALASLTAECSGNEFSARLQILSQIRAAWEKGEGISVVATTMATATSATTAASLTSVNMPAAAKRKDAMVAVIAAKRRLLVLPVATTTAPLTPDDMQPSTSAAAQRKAAMAAATSATSAAPLTADDMLPSTSAAAQRKAVMAAATSATSAAPLTADDMLPSTSAAAQRKAAMPAATSATSAAPLTADDMLPSTSAAAQRKAAMATATSATSAAPLTAEGMQPSTSAAAQRRAAMVPVISATSAATTIREQRLSQIRLPPTIKLKGRPKGAETTAIGLPKKRSSDLKQPFAKKRESEKALVILSWFVGADMAKEAMHGLNANTIQESAVEANPDNLPYAILDGEVDLAIIQKYLSEDAWMLVRQLHSVKLVEETCECSGCSADLNVTIQSNLHVEDRKLAIRCDFCLMWYHLACSRQTKKPKTKLWMCTKCRQ